MVTTPQAYMAISTGRDFVAVAQMLEHSRQCGPDRRMQVELEQRARRRLDLAREDVKASGTGDVWTRTDEAARTGQVRLCQGHARDAVEKIKGETR